MKHQRLFIILSLLIFSLLAFAIRLVPLFLVGDNQVVAAPDPYGHINRIEMQLATGEVMEQSPYWWYTTEIADNFSHDGYLFTYIGTLLCTLFNATTITQIIAVTSWIPVIIGVIVVPLMYFLGKTLTNSWKIGLLTALISSCMGLVFLHRTLYACIDHHCLEILFTVLFLLFFTLAVKERKTKNIHKFFLFAVIAGLSYGFAILSIRTCVLLGLIVVIYTIVQTIVDFKRNNRYLDLAFLNTIIFGIAAIMLTINGIKDMSMSYEIHSFGIVAIQLIVIAGTWILYGIKTISQKLIHPKQWYFYLLVLIGILAVGFTVVALALPNAAEMIKNALCNELLFLPALEGSPVYTITECQPIGIGQIISAVNIGILFIPFGIYLFIKKIKENDSFVFLAVFGIIMGYVTFLHVRWEQYFFPVVAILLALGIVQVWFIVKKASRNEHQLKANKAMVAFFVVMIVVLSCGLAVITAENYSKDERSANAIDAATWIKNNTPEYSQLEYYQNYNSQNYVEPDYTIVGGWSAGYHFLMYGQRVVLSNPIYKADGSPDRDGRTITAEILGCEDESYREMLDAVKGKYLFIMDYIHEIPHCISDWTIRGRENCTNEKMLGYRLWEGEENPDFKLVYENEGCKVFEYLGFKG